MSKHFVNSLNNSNKSLDFCRALIGTVQFGLIFTKTNTELKLSISVLVFTEKNQFGIDQN
jgi:hypothetical protein